jgi:regulator of protease activity HflC (stomatin/prohibitin superfamily)
MANPEDIFKELKIKKPHPPKGMFVVVALVVLVIIIVMLNPLVRINAGERGVVLRWGAVQPNVLDPGLHVIVPFADKVVEMDVTTQKVQTDANAASSDIQETHSVIALNYHLDPELANTVYQKFRKEYRSRIIDPAVQEAVKAVTARYTAVELVTQRDKVRDDIKQLLKDRLTKSHIIVDDFAIIDFQFSKEFSQAIEDKQVADQHRLKAQYDLERIKIEKEQKITQAQAEAEALRLQKQNISKDLIELRKIEAAQMAIQKWDGHLPSVTAGAVPFIDVKSFEK